MTKGQVDECNLVLQELNVQVAVFRDLVISIGNFSYDSLSVRRAIRSVRCLCKDLVRKSHCATSPLYSLEDEDLQPSICRLHILFYGCLEMFITEMLKSTFLMESFQLRKSEQIMCPVPGLPYDREEENSQVPFLEDVTCSSSSQELNMSSSHLDTTSEIESTESDIQEMRYLLRKLRDSMPQHLRIQDEDDILTIYPKIRKKRKCALCCVKK
ncbi:regulator of G-protein signaling 7-binding protein [Callorhinchus milii]|uniref:regulator of G-protein signaling 7-binding protein n=1 Tax=Callorhinchus milii TaxID=7868 RepID=UPI0004572B14|nr:regulator of G-protein signaling 7-binding protein [Callorhinchus milii]|eukprot:gi/632938304/ref/XP_007904505.1/ PREDICTED: regulator of G-protein signaling 7-binding protein-like [Callorhinchus milii]